MSRLCFVLALAASVAIACNPKKGGTDGADDGGDTSGGGTGGGGATGGGGTVGNPDNGSTQGGSNLPGENTKPSDLTGPMTRYIGRTVPQKQYGALMSWPGTGAQLTFTGSKIRIGMTNQQPGMPNLVDVYIDSALAQTIQLNDNQKDGIYEVAAPSAGLHTVTVIKRTEPLFGHMYFQGFQTPDGTINANTLARPARLIEFIGDNVVAGYGSEGPAGNPAGCPAPGGSVYPTNAKYNGANSAFPILTAKALNADWSVIGYSARGVAFNLDGSTGGTLPDLWPLQFTLDLDAQWDFKPAADVVVINAGTSDINYWFNNYPAVAVDKTRFINTYADLLGRIRDKYPNAYIIATMGPMVSAYTCPPGGKANNNACAMPDGSTQPTTLALGKELVQAALQKRNDPRASYLEFPASATAVSCDYHPDKTGQQNIATALVAEIRKRMSW